MAVRLVLLGAAFLLFGCTTTRESGPETAEGDVPDTPSAQAPTLPSSLSDGVPQWWNVSVRMGFEESSPVRWHLDALLADQVFAPLIERHSADLQAWRFHRRAAPDKAGHSFALLFFATPSTARAITDALGSSPLLSELQSAAVIEEIITPEHERSLGDTMGATSDATWSPAVQDTWPWFIQGVSQHWLALIQEVGAAHVPERASAAELVSVYQVINDRVTALWFQHGQHAYLHHLNALFGYQPLLLQERRGVRF